VARDYWTLSVWQDEAALRQFIRTPPHVGLMTSLRPLMGPTKFATWKITAADGRPGMAGALDRLKADDRRALLDRAARSCYSFGSRS
jgi:hypothetical protein